MNDIPDNDLPDDPITREGHHACADEAMSAEQLRAAATDAWWDAYEHDVLNQQRARYGLAPAAPSQAHERAALLERARLERLSSDGG